MEVRTIPGIEPFFGASIYRRNSGFWYDGGFRCLCKCVKGSSLPSAEKLAFKFLIGLLGTAYVLIFEGYRWFDAGRQFKGQKPFDLEMALLALFTGLVLMTAAGIFWWFRFPRNWAVLGIPGNEVLTAVCGLAGALLLAGSIFWSWMKVTAVLGAPTQGMDVK